jgi:hypothetical protein
LPNPFGAVVPIWRTDPENTITRMSAIARSLRISSLPASLETIRRQFIQQTEQMREHGILELDDET